MTAKEYLSQAYRLDQRINSDIAETDRLRELAGSVRSPGFEQHCNPNRPTGAPFERILEKVWGMEQHINDKIDRLIDLKEQIRTVIETVPDTDERMVLTFRYLHNLTWEEIGSRLYAGASTIRRWHESALNHAVVPEDAIII